MRWYLSNTISREDIEYKDPLPVYGSGEIVTFRGKRIHRGLYRTKDGILVNADLNGAANIIRKCIPEIMADQRFERTAKALQTFPRRIRFSAFQEKKGTILVNPDSPHSPRLYWKKTVPGL